VPLARVRGYKASRFSFNVRGGRCERCQGDGVIKLDMQFMADAYAPCTSCGGRRYNRETLEILFHGKSIADVLDMTVREAIQLFRNIPRVLDKLRRSTRWASATWRSASPRSPSPGGEAQRLKLSLELSKRQQGPTLYILDEPTTGLHWVDIQRLMDLLFKLRDAGNTILVIEHNLERHQPGGLDHRPGPGRRPSSSGGDRRHRKPNFDAAFKNDHDLPIAKGGGSSRVNQGVHSTS
jgi:excinuclease ABC subunit A